MESCPTQAVRPWVGLAAEKVIRDQYSWSVVIMTDQVLGRIGSVGANIAEDFNRSKKKHLNSLDIPLGEAAETKNWLYIRREGLQVQKMLNGLIRSILYSTTCHLPPDT